MYFIETLAKQALYLSIGLTLDIVFIVVLPKELLGYIADTEIVTRVFLIATSAMLLGYVVTEASISLYKLLVAKSEKIGAYGKIAKRFIAGKDPTKQTVEFPKV